ncbi:hypothetical protein SAMN04489735_1002139 [Aneurinibacillus thermoaerophilus]|uniref:Uncharacterized protein n=1 Tax=Aneurinibacillus thermoaerophilus TaxID=143495 RepID=A0A1G7WUK2_ANETH|nr:hypothetical protein SAMN04489735_1002139 [Aneurinibacillus thermoaerophilus]
MEHQERGSISWLDFHFQDYYNQNNNIILKSNDKDTVPTNRFSERKVVGCELSNTRLSDYPL